MTTPGTFNFEIVRGAALDLTFTCQTAAGAAFNLTGYTPRMLARSTVGGSVAFDFAPTVLVAADGTITVSMTDEVTLAKTVASYVYDLMLTSSGGSITGPYVRGTCNVVNKAVSRNEA